MIPLPLGLGLTLCDYVLIEEGTRKISLIGGLRWLTADSFPYVPPAFFAHAALIDGLGNATIGLRAVSLDMDDEIYLENRPVHFSDRLRELHVVFRVVDCAFPAPGWYVFELLVDGEKVTSRRLRVSPIEDLP